MFNRLQLLLMIGVIALSAPARSQDTNPPELTAEEKKLADSAIKLTRDGARLYGHGQPAEAADKLREALEILRKVDATTKYPAGHPDLAATIHNLGFVLEASGKPEDARPLFEQALAMRRDLYPKDKYPHGHAQLANSLNSLGLLTQHGGN